MEEGQEHKKAESQPEAPKQGILASVRHFYFKNHKKLLAIPFILFVLAVIQMGAQYAVTGDFLTKGVSLKGGATVTVELDKPADLGALQSSLSSEFPENDISVRGLSTAGTVKGAIIEADINADDSSQMQLFLSTIGKSLGVEMTEGAYSIESLGSSLGQSFFKEAFISLAIALALMGIVVFLYFRNWATTSAVILAAFFDIIITMAITNLIGLRISTAGIAAFLMLLGYSVDTDIVLSTRVLKRKEGSLEDRVLGAITTGMTMTVTTLVALIVGLMLTPSDTIREIMTILLIGLLVDAITTWIQNTSLIMIYVEGKYGPKN